VQRNAIPIYTLGQAAQHATLFTGGACATTFHVVFSSSRVNSPQKMQYLLLVTEKRAPFVRISAHWPTFDRYLRTPFYLIRCGGGGQVPRGGSS